MSREISLGFSRRQFLNSSACLGVAMWSDLIRSPLAHAIEPIQRAVAAPHFRFSLAAYSYRRELNSGELSLFDFVDDCARFGLDGTELTSYYFPKPLVASYLLKMKHHCFLQGLDVSGTAVGNDFGYSAGEKREEEIAAVKRWVDHAAILGAPVIRVFAGHAHDGTSEDQVHRNIVDGILECCEYAGQRGVCLALENHGGPTSTADGLLSIVRDVDHPWFGVNLDTGNFRSDNVYEDIRKAAPYAVNVQVKVMVNGADGKPVGSNFRQLAEILAEVNYRGYIVLEYEEDAEPRSECERYLDVLRNAFQI